MCASLGPSNLISFLLISSILCGMMPLCSIPSYRVGFKEKLLTSSPFFFLPKAYCFVASINLTGILYTRLLKNTTNVYGCLESWPELFRMRNDPSYLLKGKNNSG